MNGQSLAATRSGASVALERPLNYFIESNQPLKSADSTENWEAKLSHTTSRGSRVCATRGPSSEKLMNGLEALTGLQEGPKNALPDGTRYEYDPILKRTVEVTPSGERFPVTLVDGKLQRDSQKTDERNGEAA